MPLIRKIIKVGDSKAVTIPPSWLLYIERTTGQTVTEVTVEVNGCLNITPFLQGKRNNAEE
jgi:antitoxin component of MazEF toxin-antitoxin module